jgi:hypothetical protein
MVWKELEWPLRFLSQSGLPQQRESAVVPCAETIRKARLERNGFAEAGQPISIAGRKSRKKIDVQKRRDTLCCPPFWMAIRWKSPPDLAVAAHFRLRPVFQKRSASPCLISRFVESQFENGFLPLNFQRSGYCRDAL